MKPLPLAQWEPPLQHVIDDMQGQPLNIHALMARQPGLLDAWWKYRKYIVSGGDLAHRDAELVILRVAAKLRVWYEWASHVDRGLQAGLAMDEIEQVKVGPSASNWSPHEVVLLRAVDQLIDHHAIDQDTQHQLALHYTEKQVLDIISIQGVYRTIACMVNTWDPELDAHVADRLPDAVTRTAFEDEVLPSDCD